MTRIIHTTTSALLLALAASVPAASQGIPGGPATRPADDEGVKIVRPTVDRATGTVTLPGAFWNQRLADWVEVALCGRPSDFLHETLLCATTTRDELEKALRDAGFRDANAWADSVRDFPRVRGDRLLVLIRFQHAGKEETFALDELLSFQGWGTAVGPYGFMFKGDPERAAGPATAPANAPQPAADEPDSIKILRDDPQIALIFKGLQSMSQSFADHPLAYDNWIYPPLNFGRNYAALPPAVFGSNGSVPVTLLFRKVTDEQFLTESATVWHDAGWKEVILKGVPIAREIDAAKAALRKLRDDLAPRGPAATATPPPPETLRQADALNAQIEKGYAALDAAWAAHAAQHARFPRDDPQALATLQQQAALWREHLELKRVAAEQLAIVADLQRKSSPDAADAGRIQAAKSLALLAQNRQPRAYWKEQLARLDPANDPRADWIRSVRFQVELADARQEMGEAGETLGKLMQTQPPDALDRRRAQDRYERADVRVRLTALQLELVNVEFELSKGELFPDDPELPDFRRKKSELEGLIRQLQPATQPAR